jgi:hypothetical protein
VSVWLHLWNATNPTEALNGHKIRLQSIGPFKYFLEVNRINATIIQEPEQLYSVLFYKPQQFYTFDSIASAPLTEDELIVTPNIAMQTLRLADQKLTGASGFPLFQYICLGPLNPLNEVYYDQIHKWKYFKTVRAREVLWGSKPAELNSCANSLFKLLTGRSFPILTLPGLLVNPSDEETFQRSFDGIYTGKENKHLVGEFYQYKGKNMLNQKFNENEALWNPLANSEEKKILINSKQAYLERLIDWGKEIQGKNNYSTKFMRETKNWINKVKMKLQEAPFFNQYSEKLKEKTGKSQNKRKSEKQRKVDQTNDQQSDSIPSILPAPYSTDLFSNNLTPFRYNILHGSLGLQFPRPVRTSDILTVFNDKISRPIRFLFSEFQNLRGITLYRYRIDKRELMNCSGWKERANGFYSQFLYTGLLNQTVVTGGIPFFISKPHFLESDDRVFSSLLIRSPGQGSTEWKSFKSSWSSFAHDSFIDIEPITGLTFAGHKRLQLNIQLFSTPVIGWGENFGDQAYFNQFTGGRCSKNRQNHEQIGDQKIPKAVIVPIAWIDEFSSISNEKADEFRSSVILGYQIVELAPIGGLIIGSATILIAISCALNYQKLYKNKK